MDPPRVFLASCIFLCACSSASAKPRSPAPYPFPLNDLPDQGRSAATRESRAFDAAEVLYVASEDYAAAAASFQAFLSDFPASSRRGEAYLYLGECALKRGDAAAAGAWFGKAGAEREPRVATRAHLRLGDVHLEGEQIPAAQTYFQRARELAVDTETRLEAELKVGITLQKMGDFHGARRVLEPCARNAQFSHLADLARYRLQLGAYITVQVGAFESEERARARAQELRRHAIEVEVLPPGKRGNPYFRVISGRFQERDAARKRLHRITAVLADAKPFIVP